MEIAGGAMRRSNRVFAAMKYERGFRGIMSDNEVTRNYGNCDDTSLNRTQTRSELR